MHVTKKAQLTKIMEKFIQNQLKDTPPARCIRTIESDFR